jgi:hypothetical protein
MLFRLDGNYQLPKWKPIYGQEFIERFKSQTKGQSWRICESPNAVNDLQGRQFLFVAK